MTFKINIFEFKEVGCDAVIGGDEDLMKQVIDAYGAVGAVVGVNNNFMQYKGGVFSDTTCPKKVSHGVVSFFISQ